jgi:hypothetical protein
MVERQSTVDRAPEMVLYFVLQESPHRVAAMDALQRTPEQG